MGVYPTLKPDDQATRTPLFGPARPLGWHDDSKRRLKEHSRVAFWLRAGTTIAQAAKQEGVSVNTVQVVICSVRKASPAALFSTEKADLRISP